LPVLGKVGAAALVPGADDALLVPGADAPVLVRGTGEAAPVLGGAAAAAAAGVAPGDAAPGIDGGAGGAGGAAAVPDAAGVLVGAWASAQPAVPTCARATPPASIVATAANGMIRPKTWLNDERAGCFMVVDSPLSNHARFRYHYRIDRTTAKA
jgi:hypothetical protein